MRITYLLTILVLGLFSCRNNDAEKDTNNSSSGNSGKFWEKLAMVEIPDGKGGVASIMPMPSSWKFTIEGITGPKGLKITSYPLQSFMDNYDPNLQQVYEQSGQKLRSMPGMERLVQDDFIPWGNSNDLQFIKYYELPEVGKMDKWYSDQLFKALPSQSEVTAYGIDWKKKNGEPFFMIVHLNVSTSQTMQNWYYYASGLEAEPSYFEKAKKQYIFSLANTRYNLEPIAKYNKEEAERCGQSWAAFNKRMAANQAAFEAHQIAHVNKSNAINDAIMSNWRSSNEASDRQQERTIDGIYERTNVQNTETGQTYKVQEGANQYWMNSNGEYIGTKLNDYNPNLDDNMNEQKWQELQRIKQ